MNIYEEQLLEAVKGYFEEKCNRYTNKSGDELEYALYDDLFTSDVTGNNGVPFITIEDKRKKQVYDNIELLVEALKYFNVQEDGYKKALLDSVFANTIIRCYLLGPTISKFLKEKFKED